MCVCSLQGLARMGSGIEFSRICDAASSIEICRCAAGYRFICHLHYGNNWPGKAGRLFLGTGMFLPSIISVVFVIGIDPV